MAKTLSEVRANLKPVSPQTFTGDIPSFDVQPASGLVPAPNTGDAANNFFLSADGSFKSPSFWRPISHIPIVGSNVKRAFKIKKLSHYTAIRITFLGVKPDTDGSTVYFQLIAAGTNTPESSPSYVTALLEGTIAGTTIGAQANIASSFSIEAATSPNPVNSGVGNAASYSGLNGIVTISNFANPRVSADYQGVVSVFGQYNYLDKAGTWRSAVMNSYFSGSGFDWDGLYIQASGGAGFNAGDIFLEGISLDSLVENNNVIA